MKRFLAAVSLVLAMPWTVPGQDLPPYQEGWPLTDPPSWLAHFARFDGEEQVVLSFGGPDFAALWDSSGSPWLEWPEPDWSSLAMDYDCIALGDMDGDGLSDIFVPMRNINEIYVFSGATAQILPGWPQVAGTSQGLGGIEAAAMADLDGDGDLELITEGYDYGVGAMVYVFQHDGSQLPGWPKTIAEDLHDVSGIAVGDIDFDGDPEIVVTLHRYTQGWVPAKVHVYEHTGEPRPGWPAFPGSYSGFLRYPRIADLDGDGLCEVIGCNGFSLAVLNHEGVTVGAVLSPDGVGHPTAIGEVSGDGTLDVVAGGSEHAMVWNMEAGVIAETIDPFIANDLRCFSLADVDGDGASEIGYLTKEGWDNRAFVVDGQFVPLPGFPHVSGGIGTPLVPYSTFFLDFDGDGDVEFAFNGDGMLHVLDFPNPSGNPTRVDWSGLDGKPTRSAYYHEGHDVPRFIRGDVNQDTAVDLQDAILGLEYLYLGATIPCRRALDATGDDRVDLEDPIRLLQAIFEPASPPLARPYPRCGRVIEGLQLPCDTPMEVSACP